MSLKTKWFVLTQDTFFFIKFIYFRKKIIFLFLWIYAVYFNTFYFVVNTGDLFEIILADYLENICLLIISLHFLPFSCSLLILLLSYSCYLLHKPNDFQCQFIYFGCIDIWVRQNVQHTQKKNILIIYLI